MTSLTSKSYKLPKNNLHSRISGFMKYAHIVSCFPCRHSIFAMQPAKVHFTTCQFQKRPHVKSLETHKNYVVDFMLNQPSFGRRIACSPCPMLLGSMRNTLISLYVADRNYCSGGWPLKSKFCGRSFTAVWIYLFC